MPLVPAIFGEDYSDEVRKMEFVMVGMTLIRKVMRVGKMQFVLTALARRHALTRISLLDVLRTLSNCLLLFFYLVDHAQLLSKLGLLPISSTLALQLEKTKLESKLCNIVLELLADTCEIINSTISQS